MDLIPHAEYVRAKAREWVEREATLRTGVGCPDCGRELVRLRPPERLAAERTYTRCQCVACGRTPWIPD